MEQLSSFLKDLAKRLSGALPPNVHTMKKDWEKNIHSILTSAFAKLDLVTREEFDTQAKVLARTRKKLDSLENKLKDLEQTIEDASDE